MPDSGTTFVYVGNWDRHKSPGGTGIGVCAYDPETGGLTFLGSAFEGITVGAACLNPTREVLYCTDEYDTLPGNFLGGGGQIYAFAIDRGTGALTEIGHWPSFGTLPSYLALDASGSYLIVTHHTDRTPVTKVAHDPDGAYRIVLDYDDATTILFPVLADAGLGPPLHVHTHTGAGGPLPRQTHPQIHSVNMSPSGELFAVCDKGNDELLMFRIDREADRLQLCDTFRSIPGSSPRYTAFHPTRPFLFLNHETRTVVSSFRYAADGKLALVDTRSALPADWKDDPNSKQSDIKVHPSGKYLYTLVRGVSAATVFAIDDDTGALTWLQTVTLNGAGPRGCAISPDGRFLLIGALASHEVLTWAIGDDGLLSPTGRKLAQPNPGTVTFC